MCSSRYKLVALWSCLFLMSLSTFGKVLTLTEAETLFAKNNFMLLSEKYGIEVEKALAIQAGIWDNPEIGFAQEIYNKETKKYIDTSSMGQSQVTLSQLIYLAGQKQKARDAAEMNAKSKEEEFYDLLRQLKLELRSTYFQLHYKTRILSFYEESLTHLERSVETAEKNFAAGYITLTEVMRIRSMVFSIESEKKTLLIDIRSLRENLRVLLGGGESDYQTEISENYDNFDYLPYLSTPEDSLNKAYDSRPDLRAMKFLKKAESYNLSLEKARAIPNLRIGGDYDRQSNYVRDYLGLTLSFEIPIFDRNQGNIKASEARLMSIKAKEEHLRLTVERDVRLAHTRAVDNVRLLKKYKGRFNDGFERLASLLNNNYQKKYISVLEFSDSFEALRNSVTQYLLLKADRLESLENYNFVLGKEIINLAEAPKE